MDTNPNASDVPSPDALDEIEVGKFLLPHAGLGVLTARGVINLKTLDAFEQALFTAVAGLQRLVVDLTHVCLVSAAGIELLIDSNQRLGSPARLVVVAPEGSIADRVLSLACMSDGPTVYRCLQDAVFDAMTQSSQRPGDSQS
ncbi:STAS domain-containing protein [Smaragdicoccus niigatensis]|uniref:STAS domain-containing protein n=1 Tax=Smaragdicoccus niigatensis TaxID=359359 RepID=UPI000374DEEE|nr:STAS domain-containing protein [Smaragdicoccus niigatensis]